MPLATTSPLSHSATSFSFRYWFNSSSARRAPANPRPLLRDRAKGWVDPLHPPGESGGGIRCEERRRLGRIERRVAADDGIESRRVGTLRPNVREHLPQVLRREGLPAHPVDAFHVREEAIPARGPSEGSLVGPGASYPD